MLPVKSVFDVFWLVNLVEDPISVVLHRGCEYYNFVKFCHLGKELINSRSNIELSFSGRLEVMNKCLVQVQNQSVLGGGVVVSLLLFWQVRSIYQLQRLVPSHCSATNTVERRQILSLKVLDFFGSLDDERARIAVGNGVDLLDTTIYAGKQRLQGHDF